MLDRFHPPAAGLPATDWAERQVLDVVAQGRAKTTIAARLSVSNKTVRSHMSNILTKLQVTDRARGVVRQGA